MAQWEGKSKGNKTGYQIFVWVLKSFGVSPAYLLLRIVALYYFFFSTKASKQLYALYRHRLGYSRTAAILKIYRNYYLLGQSIIDKVVVMSGIKNKFTYNFDGEENLHKMAAMQKGGLLLSAHIGNWDIAGYLLKRIETRIHIVIFDGEHEQIKEYLNSVMGRQSVNIILIRNDLSHIYEITEAFRNNELVCMHADRFIEGNKTTTHDFLNEPARFPVGPFIFASSFKVPVSYVFALKESNFHYHFFASEAKTYDHLARPEAIQLMLKDFTSEMEAKVKTYPAQWFNYFNFWSK